MKGKDKGSSSKKKEPSVVGTSSTSSDRVSTLSDSINQPGKSTTNTALAIASDSSDEIASEPSLKKSKMEKNQPATHTDGSNKQLTVSTGSIFQSILEAHSFVDKTLLVREVFQTQWEENGETVTISRQHPKVMITAPRRFGKTINLDMLYHFLQLEVDEETGEKITKANLETEPVNDTRNYELFTKVKGLQVMEDKEFVQAHFGKYPVIKVSFLCTGIVRNETHAVNVCRDAIQNAFKQHCYLYERLDSKLKDDERIVCKKWCTEAGKHGNPNYKQFEPEDVIKGLKTLSRYLKMFHGRKVFVLVDEFDSIVSKAIGRVADPEELEDIIGFVIGVLDAVVKDNDENLAGTFITGILDLHGIGISSLLGNLARDTFAEDAPRMKYYGFNLGEVEKLFETFSVKEDLRKAAIAKYNSYYSKNGEHGIFNPYAIVQFLENHSMGYASLESYWQASGYIQKLDNIFKQDDVEEMVKNMLLGGTYLLKLLGPLSLAHLKDLHRANINPRDRVSIDLFCLFLLRQGYLAYTHQSPRKKPSEAVVGIPDDLRGVFVGKVVEHLIKTCGLNKKAHKDCEDQLNYVMCFAKEDKAGFERALKPFINKLGELLQTSSIDPCTEAGIQTVVSSVALAAGFTCANETHNVEQNRMDVIAHRDGLGIIIELKYHQNGNSAAGLEQIFTQGYYKEFRNKKHYPDGNIKLFLLMGIHFTEKGENVTVKATAHCVREHEINEVLEEQKMEEELKRKRKGKEKENGTEVLIELACKDGATNSFVKKAITVP